MKEMKLSVLMSVYNGMPYLPDAVQSILAQSYKDFDFVIIDDGSSDGSFDYLKSLDDERIRLFHQENQGLGAALNFGLEKIDTEFVARMDADDIAVETRLEKQINRMTTDSDLVMLGTGIAFTLDGNKTAFPPPMPTEHKDISAVLNTGGHAISHPTIMCKTNIMKKIGSYRISGVGQDWDLFLRMTEAGKVANLSEVLLHYRLHESSNAWSSSKKVNIGKKYALAAAKARRLNEEEPGKDEFINNYGLKNRFSAFTNSIMSFSDNAYRVAILNSLKSNKVKMIVAILLSSVSNPKKVYLYLKRKINNI